MNEKFKDATTEARRAFCDSIREAYPEVQTHSIEPVADLRFTAAVHDFVEHWLKRNLPEDKQPLWRVLYFDGGTDQRVTEAFTVRAEDRDHAFHKFRSRFSERWCLLSIEKDLEHTIRCSKCKGTNVQVACWVNPNKGEVYDDFGSWKLTDTKWCGDCNEHVELVDEKGSST